jgi:hypothetical protein
MNKVTWPQNFFLGSTVKEKFLPGNMKAWDPSIRVMLSM